MEVQQALIIILPLILSLIGGTTLSSILKQDGFPPLLNAVITWAVLILAAVASAYAHNELAGSDSIQQMVISVLEGIFTLILSGPLVSLRPYALGLDWIQSHAFTVTKPVTTTTPPAVLTPRASVLSSAATPQSTGAYFVRPGQSTSQQPSTLTPTITENDLGG